MPHRDLGERLRKVGDKADDMLQRLNEIVAQSGSLHIVPFPGRDHVRSRLRAEADLHARETPLVAPAPLPKGRTSVRTP